MAAPLGVAFAEDSAPAQTVSLVGPLLESTSLSLSGTALALAPSSDSVNAPPPAMIKGWSHAYSLLAQEGFERSTLVNLFRDERMPRREMLYFSLSPKESAAPYRKLNNPRARANALRFFQENKKYFDAAEKRFGVPPAVVLSILQVETGCGRNTGRSRVLPALLKLAAAGDPENIDENFAALRGRDRRVTRDAVEKRGRWLEDTFFPHVVGAIRLAQTLGVHPLELKGSFSGAMGTPQFLPAHHFRFGIDGNSDGKVDLFSAPDAIFSVSNYFRHHGWKGENLTQSQKRQVVWEYNHSVPYIDTVLAMSRDLTPGMRNPSASITALEKMSKKTKTSVRKSVGKRPLKAVKSKAVKKPSKKLK